MLTKTYFQNNECFPTRSLQHCYVRLVFSKWSFCNVHYWHIVNACNHWMSSRSLVYPRPMNVIYNCERSVFYFFKQSLKQSCTFFVYTKVYILKTDLLYRCWKWRRPQHSWHSQYWLLLSLIHRKVFLSNSIVEIMNTTSIFSVTGTILLLSSIWTNHQNCNQFNQYIEIQIKSI